MRRKIITWILLAAGACLVLAIILLDILRVGSIVVPPREPVKVITVSQGWQSGWNVGEADWFHHASQGTKIMKYGWFMALEQPEITLLTTPKKFSDITYLERFGFLPSLRDDKLNPDGLPIGFAVQQDFQEPFSEPAPDDDPSPPKFLKSPYPVVGLTCAACHTGQVNYQGRGIRIDGAPAMVNLGLFKEAIGRALAYTDFFPLRFRRFARAVLKTNYNDPKKVAELRAELRQSVELGRADLEYAKLKGLNALDAGPGRTDALTLIANRAFKDFNDRDNLAVADAPVSFPPIWNAPWYDWVQYNASIRLPMVRNIGELLGVGGLVNIDPRRGRRWISTANIENLHWMEQQIAGPKPFAGLRPPQWPKEILGDFNSVHLARGKELYQQHCIGCHVTLEQLESNLKNNPSDESLWHTPDSSIPSHYSGQGVFMRLHTTNVGRIGTDPAQAVNLYGRIVHTDSAEVKSAREVLEVVTGRIRDLNFDQLHLDEEQRLAFDSYRKQRLVDPKEQDDRETLIARLEYKAVPLSGVWCTAPYLHNGSIPTLIDLLLPAAVRPKRFYVGSREFDREKVGIVTNRSSSGFEFDTSLPGNLNCGHEFRNLTLEEFSGHVPFHLSSDMNDTERWAAVLNVSQSELKAMTDDQLWERKREATNKVLREGLYVKGVLGGEFSDEERLSLVEYLKSL